MMDRWNVMPLGDVLTATQLDASKRIGKNSGSSSEALRETPKPAVTSAMN